MKELNRMTKQNTENGAAKMVQSSKYSGKKCIRIQKSKLFCSVPDIASLIMKLASLISGRKPRRRIRSRRGGVVDEGAEPTAGTG